MGQAGAKERVQADLGVSGARTETISGAPGQLLALVIPACCTRIPAGRFGDGTAGMLRCWGAGSWVGMMSRTPG